MIVDDPEEPGNPVFYLGDETRKAQGPFPVEPGDKWRLEFRLRSTSSISSFGVTRANGSSWVGDTTFPSTGGAWQWVSKTVDISTSITEIWARFAVGTPSTGFYVDDVSLTLIERGGCP